MLSIAGFFILCNLANSAKWIINILNISQVHVFVKSTKHFIFSATQLYSVLATAPYSIKSYTIRFTVYDHWS